jgi:hypothetical protein
VTAGVAEYDGGMGATTTLGRVLLIVLFGIALIGVGAAIYTAGRNSAQQPQRAALCQDALTRRRNAEDALARLSGERIGSALMQGRENLRVAQADVQTYCR